MRINMRGLDFRQKADFVRIQMMNPHIRTGSRTFSCAYIENFKKTAGDKRKVEMSPLDTGQRIFKNINCHTDNRL